MASKSKTPWYVGGLAIECMECGNCCAGPDEGYIWITRPEIEFLAEYLNMDIRQVRRKYLKRLGYRSTIIEKRPGSDCVFLTDTNGGRGCAIYPVRPNQCRIWPFWPSNLHSAYEWSTAAMKCPGINRGRLYTFEEIQKLRKQKKWWTDENKQQNS